MLVLLGLVVLMLAAFVLVERWRQPTWHRWAAAGGGVLVLGGLVALLAGNLALQKTAGLLVMPAGLVWQLLFVRASWRTRRHGVRASGLDWLVFVAFSLAGSPHLGSAWLHQLEAPYPSIPLEDIKPLRAIFVLGGGTKVTPGGEIELSDAGDRVALGARLMHAGKTGYLVSSGRSIEGHGPSRIMAAETAELWRQLGIEDRRIVEIPNPRNTQEEVREYIEAIKAQGFDRVGVVSSAWHLPRVLRHFEGSGIEVTPIPADHRGSSLPFVSALFVPQSMGFQATQHAAWETVGMLVGR